MAYDGALSALEPSASPTIASSTTAADNREDPPPLYPSAARAKDCPPDSERGGLRSETRRHDVEMRLGAQRAFEPATRGTIAARRCGESARGCPELAEKMRAAHSSDDDSDANGYETDTIDDALDDGDGDEHDDEPLATFFICQNYSRVRRRRAHRSLSLATLSGARRPDRGRLGSCDACTVASGSRRLIRKQSCWCENLARGRSGDASIGGISRGT